MQLRAAAATTTLLLLVSSLSYVVSAANDHVRWASTGGGWRAMAASMGFAQAFSKEVGLLGSGGEITAISTNSGSSWFLLQFGYSKSFYDQVTEGGIYEFVLEWMDSYHNYTQEIYKEHLLCDVFGGDKRAICNLLFSIVGSWAVFVNGMMQTASTVYGDPTLTSRTASAENRVVNLQDTDFLVQMALAANSRSSSTGNVAYLSPNGSTKNVYAVPIPVQHVVTAANSSYFAYAIESDSLPLQTVVAPAPRSFSFGNWDEFYLYDSRPSRGSILTTIMTEQSPSTTLPSCLNEPFSGKPNVGQLAAASSAAAGFLNGAVPSLFAQVMSVRRSAILDDASAMYLLKQQRLVELNVELDLVYRHHVFDGTSVCSQWPLACEDSDGRLVDGLYVDASGLAQSVGQYQSSDNFDVNETLKLIVTSMNDSGGSTVPIQAYFATPWNSIVPGDFCWPPHSGYVGMNPMRSTQIFADYFDTAESFDSTFVPIEETTMTYSIIQTATVGNPAFGVQEGQKADVLMIQINSDIPTVVVGPDSIRQWTEPIAALAREIATSEHLVTIVEDFISL